MERQHPGIMSSDLCLPSVSLKGRCHLSLSLGTARPILTSWHSSRPDRAFCRRNVSPQPLEHLQGPAVPIYSCVPHLGEGGGWSKQEALKERDIPCAPAATAVASVTSCELALLLQVPGAGVWVSGLGAPVASGQPPSPHLRH